MGHSDCMCIEVVAPDGAVLLRLEGDTLTLLTKALTSGKPGPTVAASGVVDTVIDVIVPTGQLPRNWSIASPIDCRGRIPSRE